MMGLTEHLIELLLRSAERLERLAEVNVHEIFEQSVIYANCPSKQFIREQVQFDRFIFEENLGENLRGDVFVRLRVQNADIVALDDQFVNLLEAEVPAPSAVIVAAVLVFSDFQCLRFVAVVFRHRVLLSQERAALGASNCLIFGRPALAVKAFLRSCKKCNARAKKVRRAG